MRFDHYQVNWTQTREKLEMKSRSELSNVCLSINTIFPVGKLLVLLNLILDTRGRGHCPTGHSSDSGKCFTYDKKRDRFHCFSCHRSGDVINFVMQIENLNTKEACMLLIKENQKLANTHY